MSAPDHEHAWWLALLRAPGLGHQEALSLVERHGDAERVFREHPRLAHPDWEGVRGDISWLARAGHHFVRYDDPRYPGALKETADPPLALFVVGEVALISAPSLAIVGSRNPSASGRENAEAFARHLAECGLVIVSGLAMGVDAAAHRGALAGGRTVAVMAHGLDTVYPRQNKALAMEIAARGALVSEFPTGVPPLPEHFPRRNRIISGLAVGTLVVEATIRSGSLITARMASEQGREVFAIPGSIHNPMSKGCHHLIRQGAKLVDSAEHVLEELASLVGVVLQRQSGGTTPADDTEDESLDVEYEQLLECMEDTPLTVDRLVARSGLTPEIVSSMLLIMELRGIVRSAPGGGYAKRPKGT